MLPDYDTSKLEGYLENANKVRTSRTFKIDWQNGRLLSKTIDGTEAVAQGIQVRTSMEFQKHDMMPETFGIALQELYDSRGNPMPRDYVLANLKRIIAECIAPDLRILKILDFTMRPEKNAVYIELEVECLEGIFTTEVVLHDI